jgi:hypothetical protein
MATVKVTREVTIELIVDHRCAISDILLLSPHKVIQDGMKTWRIKI